MTIWLWLPILCTPVEDPRLVWTTQRLSIPPSETQGDQIRTWEGVVKGVWVFSQAPTLFLLRIISRSGQGTMVADWHVTSATRAENLVNDKFLSRDHSSSNMVGQDTQCLFGRSTTCELVTDGSQGSGHEATLTQRLRSILCFKPCCCLEKVDILLNVFVFALNDLSYYKIGCSP